MLCALLECRPLCFHSTNIYGCFFASSFSFSIAECEYECKYDYECGQRSCRLVIFLFFSVLYILLSANNQFRWLWRGKWYDKMRIQSVAKIRLTFPKNWYENEKCKIRSCAQVCWIMYLTVRLYTIQHFLTPPSHEQKRIIKKKKQTVVILSALHRRQWLRLFCVTHPIYCVLLADFHSIT